MRAWEVNSDKSSFAAQVGLYINFLVFIVQAQPQLDTPSIESGRPLCSFSGSRDRRYFTGMLSNFPEPSS